MCFIYWSVRLECFFVFQQKTADERRISDLSSDVCSSDLGGGGRSADAALRHERRGYPRRRDPARPRHAPAPYRERLDRVTSRRRAPTCPTHKRRPQCRFASLSRWTRSTRSTSREIGRAHV